MKLAEYKMPRYTRQARKTARRLRANATFPERLLWSRLRRRRLGTRVLRQQPIGSYIVDFYCPEECLIIEVDGRSHDGRGGYDGEREAELRRRGYRILRFTNDEVLADVDGVSEQIHEAIESLNYRNAEGRM